MQQEREVFVSLGNALLRSYCGNKIQDITGLGKMAFRDAVIPAIADRWKMSWGLLPDEETFYRAFRQNRVSAGMREKMALLYYAKTDEHVERQMNKIYERIAATQRPQMFDYWGRYYNEVSTVTKPLANSDKRGSQPELQELEARIAIMETEHKSQMMQVALEIAKLKDKALETEYALLKQQRIAGDARIRQLESEVRTFIDIKQKEDETLKVAERHFINGNYPAYQKTLDTSIKNDVKKVAQTFYLKAKGYEATLQYKDALKAYEMLQRLQPHNPEYLNALGHFLFLMADYKSALEVLLQALKVTGNGKEYEDVSGIILNNIGEVYYEKDEFDTAIKYFEKSLAVNRSCFGEENAWVANNLNNLGLCYMDKAENEKAITYYSQALDIRKKIFGRFHPEVATILSHWGLALKSMGHFDKAIKNYEAALSIEEKAHGRQHPHVANYLNNIGEVWREQSKLDKAIGNYMEAIDIYKALFPNGHPRMAGFLNNLGAAWKEKGDYDKGIRYYLQSLALNRKLFGEYNVAIGHNFNNLGLAYHGIGKNKEAIESYNEAIRVYKKLYKNAHPNIAKVYANMGGVFHDQKLYKKALQSYSRAKDMYQKCFHKNHGSLAFPIANMARVYDAQGDYDAAINSYRLALKYFVRTFGNTSINIAHIYNNIGQTWNSKGNRNNAVKYYTMALDLFIKIVGPENHYTLKCRREREAIVNKGSK